MANIVKAVERKLLDLAERAVRDCLDPVPSLSIKRVRREPRRDSARPDITLTLRTPDGDQVVLVEVKGSGQPRIVRDAANQVLRYQSKAPDAHGVLVAPYISPRSAQICIENGVGYMDGLRIASPVQVYLDLIGYRGRGEEAATFLLEQVIERTW